MQIFRPSVKRRVLAPPRIPSRALPDFGLSRASTTAVPLAASHGGGGSGCGRSSEGDGIEVERAAMGGERGALMTKHVVTRWYRAPELMISPTGRYSCAIDMWSAGCVLAEMLRRKPLFPGKHFMQQLWLIFGLLGAPADSEVAHITSQEALRFLEQVRRACGGCAGRPYVGWLGAPPLTDPSLCITFTGRRAHRPTIRRVLLLSQWRSGHAGSLAGSPCLQLRPPPFRCKGPQAQVPVKAGVPCQGTVARTKKMSDWHLASGRFRRPVCVCVVWCVWGGGYMLI